MEPQLLHAEDLAVRNVRYHFRAFHVHGGNGVSFNFRTVKFRRGDQEPEFPGGHDHQDFSFWCPLGDFMASASRRQQTIHGMMSSITSLGDSETLDFWMDQVSTYSCQIALIKFLQYNALHSFSRGAVKFDIVFRVHEAPVLHQSTVFHGEIVDGDFIVRTGPSSRDVAAVFHGEIVDGVFIVRPGPSSRDVAAASATAAIKNLERLKYGDGAQFREKDCSICLVEFESEGEDLIRMPCSHGFHHRCLARWLKRSLSCPLCRYQVNAAGEGGNRMIS